MPHVRTSMVGILIIRQAPDGRWQHLQLLRAPGDYMGGHWSLCRGQVEGEETAAQAAMRELREETGLRPTEFYRMGTLEQFYTDANDTIWHVPFLAAVVEPNASIRLNEEHTDSRWVDDADIEDHLMWPSEFHLIAELRKFILQDHRTRPLMRLALPNG